MLTARQLIQGSRPKTLLVGVSGVLVGAFCAWSSLRTWSGLGLGYAIERSPAAKGPGTAVLLTVLCVLVAGFLQIAVNFANDYSDGIRGTDAHRQGDTAGLVEAANGPVRLTASGVAPRSVLRAAIVSAGLACCAGLVAIVLTGQWWFILIGAVCLVAGWFYTGGRHPYGYMGLGEVFVFLFFGIVVVLGTEDLLLGGSIDFNGILGALSQGCLACCVMMVNNLRDIETDEAAGKQTLEVRLGLSVSRVLFVVLTVLGIAYSFGAAYMRGSFEGMFFCAATALMGAVTISSVFHRRYQLALPLASWTVFVNSLIYLLVALSS